jgi:S-adenosylmethionine synthetase
MQNYLFTSESVSHGHPDKIADQISDLVLDYFLTIDKNARVAAESFVTPKRIILAGEVSCQAAWQQEVIEQKIRELIKDIGYIDGLFNYRDIIIEIDLNKQSSDIAQGVNLGEGLDKSEGAGDQGIMFGYACNETENFMPAPIYYSHQILQEIYKNKKNGKIKGFGEDAKSQITMRYHHGKPVEIATILVSIQHEAGLSLTDIEKQLKPIILEIIPSKFINNTKFIFNPTGQFIIGGPESDVGLTGRKIIVDTYGGAAPHGGGAFSGKDPTKVDRSAAYLARYLAKNIVAANLAEKCLIQLSYGIGISKPISFFLDSFGTGKIRDSEIAAYLIDNIEMTPQAIRERFQLNKPIYLATASYGHFGRKFSQDTGFFSWENLDLSLELKKNLNKNKAA